MRLYLYETEVLRQKGSALRGMIRNSSTPILDLLVRESIQNSLDAKDECINSRFVNVGFTTGQFRKELLDRELDGINLASRTDWSNTFIAISDTGTTGLTGNFDDDTGNLSKLVFGIYEAQQASGAGGCWGVGKTVYFRIGTGLVIYYSRIKKASGDYDSLLSVAFVEDETKKDSLLPAASDGKKYGIAWWGEPVPGRKRVRETHNERVIGNILGMFGIKPYEGRQTGTVILIPFTDEKALLANNQPEREDGSPAPYWTTSVPEYLKYSVQKWYSARLCNRKYPFGKYLNVSINGRSFDPYRDMEPFFRLTQTLYNKAALTLTASPDADNICFEDAEIQCEEIRVRKQIDPVLAGCVAFAKLSRRQLGMLPPENRPSPYEYISSYVGEKDPGKPIILFCRKPGMIVRYDKEKDWTEGITKTEENEFLVAFFVLNGAPTLKNTTAGLTLEDYVRKSEQADHLSWDDYNIMEDNLRPSIIEKIKNNTAKKIEAAMRVAEDDNDRTTETGLSSRIGGLLLPPVGFGRKPSSSPDTRPGGGEGGGSSVRRNVRYTYRIEEFTASGMVLNMHISSGNKVAAAFGFSIDADSVNGSITAAKWLEEMDLAFPFFISGSQIILSRTDSERTILEVPVGLSGDGAGLLAVLPRKNSEGDMFGLSFSFSDSMEHSFDIDVKLVITVRRRDIRPSISFD